MLKNQSMLMAAIKPFLPMVKQHLGPMVEQVVDGQLNDIRKACPDKDPNTPLEPIIVLAQDKENQLYIIEGYLNGKTIETVKSRKPIQSLTNSIINLLDDNV